MQIVCRGAVTRIADVTDERGAKSREFTLTILPPEEGEEAVAVGDIVPRAAGSSTWRQFPMGAVNSIALEWSGQF